MRVRFVCMVLSLVMAASMASSGMLALATENDEAVIDTELIQQEEPAAEETEGPAAVEDEPAAQVAVEAEASDEPAVDSQDAPEPATSAEAENVQNEPAAGEVASYPAITLTGSAAGVDVTVEAPEGALPEGATLQVTDATSQIENVQIESVTGQAVNDLRAVDISFHDAAGNEIEPAADVKVSLASPFIVNAVSEDGEDPTIVHIADDGNMSVVEQSSAPTAADEIAFESDDFSVYVIVDGESGAENARLKVTFMAYDADAGEYVEYATMYVTKQDIDPSDYKLDAVLYDPGVAYVDGANFGGWTDDPDYTAETASLTIDDIRTEAESALNEGVTEGDELVYYGMLFNEYHVSYLDEAGTTLGERSVKFRFDSNESAWQDFTVNMSYTPTSTQDFQGWYVAGNTGENIEGFDPEENEGNGTIYLNGTGIKIKGDVVFSVNAPQGHWLVFNENGKGADYRAPQFVLDGTVTSEPTDPTRLGYTFGGWFDTKAHADAHGADTSVTEGAFTFGEEIDVNTTVYASWIPNETANYTVLIWKQNADRTGYDFVTSQVGEGSVGDYIIADEHAITTGTVGDLTYVTVDGQQYGGVTSVAAGTPTDTFAGFTLSSDPIADAQITAEGDAAINIYFDREQYTLRFYVTQTNSAGTGNYRGAGGGGTGFGNANWNRTLSRITTISGMGEQDSTTNGSNRYFYYEITAYYGEDISWPAYGDINSSMTFVSWLLMPTAKAYTGGPGTGGNTVKGTVNVMDEQVLGDLSHTGGAYNYVTARYENSPNDWTYEIYLANPDGSYPSEPSFTVEARSKSAASGQHAPAYDGYTCDESLTENDGYTMRFYYTRNAYTLNFMDGEYIGGNSGTHIQNMSANQLHFVENVAYGEDISTYADYEPACPEEGYIFLGWYVDEAGTTPYDFDEAGTMPLGGLTLYAKWHLHRSSTACSSTRSFPMKVPLLTGAASRP